MIMTKCNNFVLLPDQKLSENIRLITASNSSPLTNLGTNTYCIGIKELILIDPGPNITDHFNNICNLIGNAKLSHIVLTHSHQDHCAMAIRLAAKSGSKICLSGDLVSTKEEILCKIQDKFDPTDLTNEPFDKIEVQVLTDKTKIYNNECCLDVIFTPGHMSDHVCLALNGTDILFTGDHVMGWSSTVIIPPSGNMRDFMMSLKKLLYRKENVYLPGHGRPISNAKDYVRLQINHKKFREEQILDLIKTAPAEASELVSLIYPDLDKRLSLAAENNIYAHLINLYSKNFVYIEKKMSITTKFFCK